MKEEWERTWKERMEELALWFGETRMDVVTLEGGSGWTYVGKVSYLFLELGNVERQIILEVFMMCHREGENTSDFECNYMDKNERLY